MENKEYLIIQDYSKSIEINRGEITNLEQFVSLLKKLNISTNNKEGNIRKYFIQDTPVGEIQKIPDNSTSIDIQHNSKSLTSDYCFIVYPNGEAFKTSKIGAKSISYLKYCFNKLNRNVPKETGTIINNYDGSIIEDFTKYEKDFVKLDVAVLFSIYDTKNHEWYDRIYYPIVKHKIIYIYKEYDYDTVKEGLNIPLKRCIAGGDLTDVYILGWSIITK